MTTLPCATSTGTHSTLMAHAHKAAATAVAILNGVVRRVLVALRAVRLVRPEVTSMSDDVVAILSRGTPHEVGRPVIGLVPVQVAHFGSGRTRSNESLGDKMVHIAPSGPPFRLRLERDKHVSEGLVFVRLPESLGNPIGSLAAWNHARNCPHPPVVGNLVEAFPIHHRSPRFDRHEKDVVQGYDTWL